MRHLSNILDPRKPMARSLFCHDHNDIANGPLAMNAAWKRHIDWVNQNIIGRPQATASYTVEQLEEMGMIGIYSKE